MTNARDPETWRAMAADPGLGFHGLWGDAGAVVAWFERADRPLIAAVAVEQGFYPALSPFRPEAAAFERMVRDLWGYAAAGGTDPRPLLDFGHWPIATPLARASAPFAPEPATSGLAHKGTLGLMRGKSPRVAARFAARVAAEATVAHSVAFAAAAESAAGIAAPARAVALREAMLALERAAAGLARLAAIAEAAPAPLLMVAAGRVREGLARAAAAGFGHRLMMDAVVPGGVAVDPGEAGAAALRRWAAEARREDLAPLARATLDTRLAVVPVAAEARDAALAALETGIAVAETIGGIEEGPALVSLPPSDGDGTALVAGPDGDIRHWLRLESGQIAAAFLRDGGWSARPPAEAAIAAAAPADRALVAAAIGLGSSGVDL